MISPRLESGGLQRYLMAEARGLVARGHHVATAYGGAESAQERWLRELSIPVRRVSRVALDAHAVPGWVVGLRKMIADEAPDVIHAHSLTAGAAATLAAPRVPRVVTLHGVLAGRERRDARLARIVPAALVAVSHALAEEFRGYQPRLQIQVIHSGIDVAVFRKLAGEAAPPLPVGRPRFVCVARHDPPKGVDVVIEAFATIAAEVPSAVLVLVGAGPATAGYRSRVESLGLGDRIVFAGDVVNPAPLLNGADAAVLASRQEGGVPLALLEALALSVPVVAAAVGGVPELVRPGTNGELVAPDDVPALAAALLAIARDPDRARELGASGRRLVEGDFSVVNLVDAHELLLQGAAGRTRAR